MLQGVQDLCSAHCVILTYLCPTAQEHIFFHEQVCIDSVLGLTTNNTVCWLQALQEAAAASNRHLSIFSPAVLRQALRQAGNILKPEEVEHVLEYTVKDQDYPDLDQLYVVLLRDGSVQQLRCN